MLSVSTVYHVATIRVLPVPLSVCPSVLHKLITLKLISTQHQIGVNVAPGKSAKYFQPKW